MQSFFLCFLPLFVAIDVLAAVPVFLALSQGYAPPARTRLAWQATFTATAVSIVFLVAGDALFQFLGITENDFRIGGGLLLLVISVADLMGAHSKGEGTVASERVGVVPLGIPLIMGPAALTTLLMQVDTFGYGLTVTALVVNMLIVWLALRNAGAVTRVLGEGGAQALAKVASLFMAAIAVMMIRVGLQNVMRAM